MSRMIKPKKMEEAVELVKKNSPTRFEKISWDARGIHAVQFWPTSNRDLNDFGRILKKLFGKRFKWIIVESIEDRRLKLWFVIDVRGEE